MKRRHSAIVFFVILTLGMSLAVPAEDLPETAFDESETLPYESTPSFAQVHDRNCRQVHFRLTRVSRPSVCSAPRHPKRRTEHNPLPVPATEDFLIILDHSFRC